MMLTLQSRDSRVLRAGFVLRCGLIASVAAIISCAGASASLAQDGEDDADSGADSLEVEVPPSGAEVAENPDHDQRLWEVHPSYTVSINKRKDVTNWDNKISLNKDLSSKISLNLNGSVVSRENTTLSRLDASNGTSAALRYKMNSDIGFVMTYSTNVSSFSYDLKGRKPADKKKNEDLTISSELNKKLFDAADVNVRVTAGSTSNSFALVSNKGRKQALTASMAFAPSPKFRASATYTGNRLFLDSQVDSSGGAPFKTEDRTFSNNIAFSLSYEMLPGIRFGADASEGTDQRQHPDPDKNQQETEKKASKSASLTSSFEFIKWLTWDMAVRFNSYDNTYEIRKTSNSKSKSANLEASAKITAWRGASLNAGGTREISRDIYESGPSGEASGETGDNLHKSLSLRLTQDLGPKADLNVTAISDLISVAYDDKAANPKDRDRLSNRVSADLTYLPYARITTRFGGEYSQEQSIYVKAASSANNRTQTRYRVTGSYDVKTFRKIGLSQTYEIGAVYTVYQFDESNNSLVRNSNISTRFRVPVITGVQLDLDHAYRYQDQGSYRESGKQGLYGRSGGSESNTLGIGTGYTLGRIHLSFRQAYYVQDTWDFKDGKKVFKHGNWSVEISGKANFKYEFKERTKFSISLEQNRKEGTSISEAFRRYWNVELEASHVF